MRGTGAFWSTVRLFVAVWPPVEVVAALSAMARPEMAGLRWTTVDQWHVTLRFLGEADPDEWVAKMHGLRFGPSPEAILGCRAERLGRDVLCLPVGGLEGLAAIVDPAPARPFRGHLTVARRRSGRLPTGVRLPHEARWVVDEVTLVASHLHPTGAEYTVVERFPLHADGHGA